MQHPTPSYLPAVNTTGKLLPPTEVDSDRIPLDCCYHCQTRGGNAAWECAKPAGEERCTRCVRDKQSKCRLPTAEEATRILRRCPQCKARGFKGCNEGSPCNTCIKNETADKCRTRQYQRRIRPAPNPVKIEEAAGHANESVARLRKHLELTSLKSQRREART